MSSKAIRRWFISAQSSATSAVTEGRDRRLFNLSYNPSPSSHVATRIPDAASPSLSVSRNAQLLRSRRIAKASKTATGHALPLNASSRWTSISASHPRQSLRRAWASYLSLSKPRLSFLVVLTTTAAYALYPVPDLLQPSNLETPSLSPLTLLFLTTGTALASASANTLNMLYESKTDALMSRTKNRPLVRKLVSNRGAVGFACATASIGLAALYYGVNPTVSFLSAANIVIYAGVYTPLKRISVINTWVGAIVGGIPPLMGWAAAAGQVATGGGWQELLFSYESTGGWLLAALLFCWQYPHFNSLSWTIREEYKHAGHQMLAWVNPRMNARVALRYSVFCLPVCAGLWYFSVVDRGFLVTSSLPNIWLIREAWRFQKYEGFKGSARGLFWASVWHLPIILVLAILHKEGLWQGLWHRLRDSELRQSDSLHDLTVKRIQSQREVLVDR